MPVTGKVDPTPAENDTAVHRCKFKMNEYDQVYSI